MKCALLLCLMGVHVDNKPFKRFFVFVFVFVFVDNYDFLFSNGP
jgi:hypothetical protein